MNDQDRAEAFLLRLKALPKRPKVTQTDVDRTKREAAIQDYQNRLQRKQRGASDYVKTRNLYGPSYSQTDYANIMETRRRQRRQSQAADARIRRNLHLHGYY